MRFAVAIALVASSASAEGLRGSLTGGIGVGHSILGLQLEVGASHWSGFASLAPFPGLKFSHTVALGGRWSSRPDGSGFGIAVQAAIWTERGPAYTGLDYRASTTFVSATAHWRWLIVKYLLIDVGAGPAATFRSFRFPTRDYGADSGRWRGSACFGIDLEAPRCSDVGIGYTIPFDLELGLGFAF